MAVFVDDEEVEGDRGERCAAVPGRGRHLQLRGQPPLHRPATLVLPEP